MTYGEEIELPQSRGTFKTVGDGEHARIISFYLDEDKSMVATAKMLGLQQNREPPH